MRLPRWWYQALISDEPSSFPETTASTSDGEQGPLWQEAPPADDQTHPWKWWSEGRSSRVHRTPRKLRLLEYRRHNRTFRERGNGRKDAPTAWPRRELFLSSFFFLPSPSLGLSFPPLHTMNTISTNYHSKKFCQDKILTNKKACHKTNFFNFANFYLFFQTKSDRHCSKNFFLFS